MVPSFLANNPSLRRRYEQESRRLGKNCTGCAKASLDSKYQRLAIQETIANLPKKKRRA